MGARPLGRDSKLKDFSKSSYINTKRKIKDELGITDKDWFAYSQVLKRRKNRMQPTQMVNLQRGLNRQWVEPIAPPWPSPGASRL